MMPGATPAGPLDGVAAMLAILSVLADRRSVTCRDVEALTGLSSRRLCGYSAILQEDGLVIFEWQQTLRLTNCGEAALRDFGKLAAGLCSHPDAGGGDG